MPFSSRLLRYVILSPKGWYRSFHYLGLRIARLPGSPYHIAAGFACGVAISFTPFIGLHLILTIGLAALIGGSVLASLIGTLVGNPITFPFIWYFAYRSGVVILRMLGLQSWLKVEISGTQMLHELTIGQLFDKIYDLFLPMLVGGMFWAVISWPLCFIPARIFIQAYQKRRRQRLQNGPRRGHFQNIVHRERQK